MVLLVKNVTTSENTKDTLNECLYELPECLYAIPECLYDIPECLYMENTLAVRCYIKMNIY